jgi:hypothetical protein
MRSGATTSSPISRADKSPVARWAVPGGPGFETTPWGLPGSHRAPVQRYVGTSWRIQAQVAPPGEADGLCTSLGHEFTEAPQCTMGLDPDPHCQGGGPGLPRERVHSRRSAGGRVLLETSGSCRNGCALPTTLHNDGASRTPFTAAGRRSHCWTPTQGAAGGDSSPVVARTRRRSRPLVHAGRATDRAGRPQPIGPGRHHRWWSDEGFRHAPPSRGHRIVVRCTASDRGHGADTPHLATASCGGGPEL